MTFFYIVLLISIVVLVSLCFWCVFDEEKSIVIGIVTGLWLCLILFCTISFSVEKSGLKRFDKEFSKERLIPLDGDSIFLRKSLFDYYLFGTDANKFALTGDYCEILPLPDTIHPYCTIYNCSLKRWARLFYQENSWMAKQKSFKIYIPEIMIYDDRPALTDSLHHYYTSRGYLESLYNTCN